ncbi:hypothetical protein [Haladaptatus halobius]|nr:hypothetical protein [Haladaptatus halobius]
MPTGTAIQHWWQAAMRSTGQCAGQQETAQREDRNSNSTATATAEVE